jgi:hypothetical protein
VTSSSTARHDPFWATAAAAGLTGAALIDAYLIVVESFVLKNATPQLVMQWDASNALGMAAYRGGWATAVLGTLMHFCVSIAWAAIFVAIATRVRWLTRRPVASGALLGVVAMTVMRAVIHLGHAVIHPFTTATFVVILIAHTLFFGLPVALVAASMRS